MHTEYILASYNNILYERMIINIIYTLARVYYYYYYCTSSFYGYYSRVEYELVLLE